MITYLRVVSKEQETIFCKSEKPKDLIEQHNIFYKNLFAIICYIMFIGFSIFYVYIAKFTQVSGNTGTAQKYENGRIAVGKYVSSFIGFMPVDNPKYLVFVVVDEPQGAYYGSVVSAPIAKEIFEGIISLKNIQAQDRE